MEMRDVPFVFFSRRGVECDLQFFFEIPRRTWQHRFKSIGHST